jgi:hypothetical protein
MSAVLLECVISAAPVVDRDGRLVGIVSEGDLMRRAEIGTERRRSWWLELFQARRSADLVIMGGYGHFRAPGNGSSAAQGGMLEKPNSPFLWRTDGVNLRGGDQVVRR